MANPTPSPSPSTGPTGAPQAAPQRARAVPKISLAEIEKQRLEQLRIDAQAEIQKMSPVSAMSTDGLDETKEGCMVKPIMGRLADGLFVAGTDIGAGNDQGDKLYINGEKGVIAAVDGMSGQARPELAADEFNKELDKELTAGKSWNEAVSAAKFAIKNVLTIDPAATNAGVCFAAMQVEGDELSVRHAGDSRVMVFSLDGEEVNRTVDENLGTKVGLAEHYSQDKIDQHPELSDALLAKHGVTQQPNQPKIAPYSVVTNSLRLENGNVEGTPHVSRMPIKENQIAVVCTDGITDVLTGKEIGALIRQANGNIALAYKAIEREVAKRNGRPDAQNEESKIKKYGIESPSQDNRTLALYIHKPLQPKAALEVPASPDAKRDLDELLKEVTAIGAEPVKALRKLLTGLRIKKIPESLTGSLLEILTKDADPISVNPLIPDPDLTRTWATIQSDLKADWTPTGTAEEQKDADDAMKVIRTEIENEIKVAEQAQAQLEAERQALAGKEHDIALQERNKMEAILSAQEAERIARRTDIMNPTSEAFTSAYRDLFEKRAAEGAKTEKEYNVAEIYKKQPWYTKISARIGNLVDKARAGLNSVAKAVDHGIRGVAETAALAANEKAQQLREKGGWLNRIGAGALDALGWTASEAGHFATIAAVKLPRVAATIVNFAAHGAVNVVKDFGIGGVERLVRGKERMRELEADKLARIFGMDPDNDQDAMWETLNQLDAEFPGMKIKILRDLLAINNERGAQKMIKEYTDEEHEEFAFNSDGRQGRKQALLNKYKTADEKSWKHTLVSGKSYRAFGRTWQWPGLAKMPLGGFFVKSYNDSDGRKQERLSLNLSGGVLGLLTMVDTMTDSLSAAHHTAQRGPRNFLNTEDINKYIGLLKHQHLDETLRSKTDKDRETASSFLAANLDRDVIGPAMQSEVIQNLEVAEGQEIANYLKNVPSAFEAFLKTVSQEKIGQQDRLDAFQAFKTVLTNPQFTSEILKNKSNHALSQILASIQSQFLQHAEAAMTVDYTESLSPRYQSGELKEGAWESIRRTGLPYAAGRIVKTKWSFVLAKSVLAHSGLMAGGVAAAGAHSAAAFMNPSIMALAGVSVMKDAVSEAMYNGAIQEFLKENEKVHLNELSELYTGRTMFGEHIPADIVALQTTDAAKYQEQLGRWILNRVRQHITNPNAIRVWAQELASLPFDPQTNNVDVEKAYKTSKLLQELLYRFEKGEIAGRGQGIIFNTASELVEGKELNQFIRTQLSTVELHIDNQQRQENIQKRIEGIKQGSAVRSLLKGLRYGVTNAATDFEKTASKMLGTFIYQGPLLVVDQSILHTLEHAVQNVPYAGHVYAPVMQVINYQSHLVQDISSGGEGLARIANRIRHPLGGDTATRPSTRTTGAPARTTSGARTREAPVPPVGGTTGATPERPATGGAAAPERPTVPTEAPRAPVPTEAPRPTGAPEAPRAPDVLPTVSVAAEVFNMAEPRVAARGREGTMIDYLRHHGVDSRHAGRVAHLFELRHVAPASSEFRTRQHISHPTDTITIRVDGNELIMESRRYRTREHTGEPVSLATGRAPITEVAGMLGIEEATLRGALSGGPALTATTTGAPRPETTTVRPTVAATGAAVESAAPAARPTTTERPSRGARTRTSRVESAPRVEPVSPAPAPSSPRIEPSTTVEPTPVDRAREEARFAPRYLIDDTARREVLSAHATESGLDVHGYAFPGHIAVDSRTPGATGRIIFRVIRTETGAYEVRQIGPATGVFVAAHGMHGSLDSALARLHSAVERRSGTASRERDTAGATAAVRPATTERARDLASPVRPTTETRGARTATTREPTPPSSLPPPSPRVGTDRGTEARVESAREPAPRVEPAARTIERPTESVRVEAAPAVRGTELRGVREPEPTGRTATVRGPVGAEVRAEGTGGRAHRGPRAATRGARATESDRPVIASTVRPSTEREPTPAVTAVRPDTGTRAAPTLPEYRESPVLRTSTRDAIDNDTRVGLSDMLNADSRIHEHLDVAPYGTGAGAMRVEALEGTRHSGRAVIQVFRNADGSYRARPIGPRTGRFAGISDADLTGPLPEVLGRLSDRVASGTRETVASGSSTVLASRTAFAGYERESRARIVPVIGATDFEVPPATAVAVMNARLDQRFRNVPVGEVMDDVRDDFLHLFPLEGPQEQLRILREMEGYGHINEESIEMARELLAASETHPWAARISHERIETAIASALDGGTISARELADELRIPLDEASLRSPAVQRAIAHLQNLANYAGHDLHRPAGWTPSTWRDILARGAARREFRIDPIATYRAHPTGPDAMLAMYQSIADIDHDNKIEIPGSGEGFPSDISVHLGRTGEAGTESNLYTWLLEMRRPRERTNPQAVIRDIEDLRALGEEYLRSPSYLADHPGASGRTASASVTRISVELTRDQLEAIRYGLLIASQQREHNARTTIDAMRAERERESTTAAAAHGSSIPTRLDTVDHAVLTRVAPAFAARENLSSMSDADLNTLRTALTRDLARHPTAPSGMTAARFEEHIRHEAALIERINGIIVQRSLLSEANADRMAREMSDAIFRERGVRISAERIRQEIVTLAVGGGVVFRPGGETTGGAGIGARVTPFRVTSDDGRHTFEIGVDMGIGVGSSGGGVGATAGVGVDARYTYRIGENGQFFTGAGAGLSLTGPAAGIYAGFRFGVTDSWDGSATVAGGISAVGPNLGVLLGAEYSAQRDFEHTRDRLRESMGITNPDSTSIAHQRLVVERYGRTGSEHLTDAQVSERYAQLWRGLNTASAERIDPNGVTGFGVGVGVVNGIVAFGPYIRITIGSHMVYELRETEAGVESARIRDLNTAAIEAIHGVRTAGPEGSSITTYRIHIESPDVGTAAGGDLRAISGTGRTSETVVRFDDTRERSQIVNEVLRTANLSLEGDRLGITTRDDNVEYRFISHVPGLTVTATPDESGARLTTTPDVGSFTIVRRRIVHATPVTAGEHDNVEVIIFVPLGRDRPSDTDLDRMLTEDTLRPADYVAADFLHDRPARFRHRIHDTRRPGRVIYRAAGESEAEPALVSTPVPVGNIREATVAGDMSPEVRTATLRVYESFTTGPNADTFIERFRHHANDARRRHVDSDAAWRRDMVEFVQTHAREMGVTFPADYNWDYLLGSLVMAANVSNISNRPLPEQRHEIVRRLHAVEWEPAPLFRHAPRMSAPARTGIVHTVERLLARVPTMTGVGPTHASEGTPVPTGATYRIMSRYGVRDDRYGFRPGTATRDNHPILAISESAHLTPDGTGPDAAAQRHIFRTLETEERTAVRTYRFFYSVLNTEERAIFERAVRDRAAHRPIAPEAQALVADWQALTREIHDRAAEGRPSVVFSRGGRSYTINMTTTVGMGIFSTDSNPDTDPTRGYCGNVTIFADLDLAADFEVVRPGREIPVGAYRDLYNVPTEVVGTREGGVSLVLGAAVGIAPAVTPDHPTGGGRPPDHRVGGGRVRGSESAVPPSSETVGPRNPEAPAGGTAGTPPAREATPPPAGSDSAGARNPG